MNLESTNSQVAGFDSEDDVVDLIHRITNNQIFRDTFNYRLKGSLGDNLSLIVSEIQKICEENEIDLNKFLEMRKRFENIGSSNNSH